MSKGLATRMRAALEAVKELPDGTPRPHVTDEALARMDWVASLTDTDIEHIKNGLVLLGRSAEFFHRHIEERAITRLADALEALP